MKKTIAGMLLAGLTFSVAAQQQGFISPDSPAPVAGGFQGPAPTLSSVARAKSLPDDAWVVLEGHLLRQTGHEQYEFRDNSGTVVVEIDDRHWTGQTADPSDKVRIEGKVDREWDHTEIDVKTIRVLK